MKRSLGVAVTAVALLALTSCAGINPRVPLKFTAAHGRFAVQVTRQVVRAAANHQVPLQTLTEKDLVRIDSLLPGPPTTVTLTVGDPDQILPSTGTSGFTDPESGAVTIGLYPYWAEEPPDFAGWLARTLAGQVSHSVRVEAGPGLGTTLLDQLVTEGVATAFDEAAFPGPKDPWVEALSPLQECQQWQHLKPVLNRVGLYQQVMTGGPVQRSIFAESTMPPLTGLAIGYQILAHYLRRHPSQRWGELVTTSGGAIFAHSGFAPCPAA